MALEKMTSTTYKADNLGDVRPSVVIGGSIAEKCVPNVNMSFGLQSTKEQFFLNINRKSVVVGSEKEALSSEKLALTVGNETDLWHVDENGHLKWDIEFAARPSTNVFSWELLHSEGLEFCYQPPLTQAEIDKGIIRPDNVVGSYAVYCNKSGHFKDASGNTVVNYATGKLLHIYRPLCIDAKGNKEWAELLIEKGTLTITIPQKFLDNAVYPMVLDPTFGYTTAGASGGSTSTGSTYWPLDAVNPAGTLTNISIYCTDNGINDSVQWGFYSDNGGVPDARLAYDASTWGLGSTSTMQWKTNPVSWSYSLVEGNQCWASNHSVNYGASGTFGMDSGGSKANRYNASNTTPPASAGSTSQDYSNAHFSIYATYTAGTTESYPLPLPWHCRATNVLLRR